MLKPNLDYSNVITITMQIVINPMGNDIGDDLPFFHHETVAQGNNIKSAINNTLNQHLNTYVQQNDELKTSIYLGEAKCTRIRVTTDKMQGFTE